jgi:hypothetical protein
VVIGDIDIHIHHDYAFRDACSHGHLEVAQWSYSFGGVNIHSEDDSAFREACCHGHLSVVQ